MTTNLSRVNVTGVCACTIIANALGMSGVQPIEVKQDWLYRSLIRRHKAEILTLCEDYSRKHGLRLERRILP